ncbi:MAG: twin-arginine translocase TatA/TatE family subunit [Terriglobales bacterium]
MFDGIFRPEHLIIILVICLLIFGPKKLPELGKGIGDSIREFKKSMADSRSPAKTAPEAEPAAAAETKK